VVCFLSGREKRVLAVGPRFNFVIGIWKSRHKVTSMVDSGAARKQRLRALHAGTRRDSEQEKGVGELLIRNLVHLLPASSKKKNGRNFDRYVC